MCIYYNILYSKCTEQNLILNNQRCYNIIADMKSVTVKKNDEGQRLDKFLQKK